MKRIVSITIVLILAFSLAACGAQPARTDVSAPASKPSVAEPTPSQEKKPMLVLLSHDENEFGALSVQEQEALFLRVWLEGELDTQFQAAADELGLELYKCQVTYELYKNTMQAHETSVGRPILSEKHPTGTPEKTEQNSDAERHSEQKPDAQETPSSRVGERASGTYTSEDGLYTADVGKASLVMNGKSYDVKMKFDGSQPDTPNPFSTYTPRFQIDETYNMVFYLNGAVVGETYGTGGSTNYTGSSAPEIYLLHGGGDHVVISEDYTFTVEHAPTLENPLLLVRFTLTYGKQSALFWATDGGEIDGFFAMDMWSDLHKDDIKKDHGTSETSTAPNDAATQGNDMGHLVPMDCPECFGIGSVLCRVCGGTGTKPGQAYACMGCGGAGEILCRYCGGMGYKLEYRP